MYLVSTASKPYSLNLYTALNIYTKYKKKCIKNYLGLALNYVKVFFQRIQEE